MIKYGKIILPFYADDMKQFFILLLIKRNFNNILNLNLSPDKTEMKK